MNYVYNFYEEMKMRKYIIGMLVFYFLMLTVIFVSMSDLLKETLSVIEKIRFGGIAIIGMTLMPLFLLIPGRRS